MDSVRYGPPSKRAKKRQSAKGRKQRSKRDDEELEKVFQRYRDDKMDDALFCTVPTSPFTFSSSIKPPSLMPIDMNKREGMMTIRGRNKAGEAGRVSTPPSRKGCNSSKSSGEIHYGRLIHSEEQFPHYQSCASKTEFNQVISSPAIMERVPVPGRRGGHSAPPTISRGSQDDMMEYPSNSICSLADMTDRCSVLNIDSNLCREKGVKCGSHNRRASSAEVMVVRERYSCDYGDECLLDNKVFLDGLSDASQIYGDNLDGQRSELEQGRVKGVLVELQGTKMSRKDKREEVVAGSALRSESPDTESEEDEHTSDTVEEEGKCLEGHMGASCAQEGDTSALSEEDAERYEVIERSEEHLQLYTLFQHRRQSLNLGNGARIHIIDRRISSPIDEGNDALSPTLRRLKARLEAGKSGKALLHGNHGTQNDDDKQRKARTKSRKSGASAVKWAAARRMRDVAATRPHVKDVIQKEDAR